MNVYVLMIACVSPGRGWNRSPPRWSARRLRCSPSCSRMLHETARPSRALQASSTRHRPHMARANHVSSLPSSLPSFLSSFLPSRLRNESPAPAETAANEHNRDSQTTPDKGGYPNLRNRWFVMPCGCVTFRSTFRFIFRSGFRSIFRWQSPQDRPNSLQTHTISQAQQRPTKVRITKLPGGTPVGECDTEYVREKPAGSGLLRACDSPVNVISSTIHEYPRRRRP